MWQCWIKFETYFWSGIEKIGVKLLEDVDSMDRSVDYYNFCYIFCYLFAPFLLQRLTALYTSKQSGKHTCREVGSIERCQPNKTNQNIDRVHVSQSEDPP